MISTYKKILDLLDKRDRQRFFILLGLLLLLSFFAAASLVSILPFLQLITNPDMIQETGVLSWLYETGGFESERQFLVAFGILVFVVTVTGSGFRAAGTYLITRFALMRSYNISARLLSRYLNQPYIWFVSRHSSTLSQGVLAEVDRMVRTIFLPSLHIFSNAVTILLLGGFLFALEPVIALSALVLLSICYGLIYMAVRKVLLQLGKRRQMANRRRFHVVQEATGGAKEMKLMGLERSYLNKFRYAALGMAQAQTKSSFLSQLPRYLLESLVYGGMIFIILAMLARPNTDITSIVPTLGVMAIAGNRLLPALQSLYAQFASIRSNQSVLDSIHEDLVGLETSDTAETPKSRKEPPIVMRTAVTLDNIRYTYPGVETPALEGLSLNIPTGSMIGIVGGTGAGKTTLVDLILGLLHPDSGRILIDGTALTPETVRPWQRSLGYVPQNIFLADETITRNIAFGLENEHIDMEAVQNAAKAAALHDFIINDLDEGYETRVGERGVRLSGGQRQRIGIARALYHNPSLLIMDEATSALDNITERQVMASLDKIAEDRTVLMIAHRLSTVENCDQIFLLKNGAVAASGTYEELTQTSEDFRKMVFN